MSSVHESPSWRNFVSPSGPAGNFLGDSTSPARWGFWKCYLLQKLYQTNGDWLHQHLGCGYDDMISYLMILHETLGWCTYIEIYIWNSEIYQLAYDPQPAVNLLLIFTILAWKVGESHERCWDSNLEMPKDDYHLRSTGSDEQVQEAIKRWVPLLVSAG